MRRCGDGWRDGQRLRRSYAPWPVHAPGASSWHAFPGKIKSVLLFLLRGSVMREATWVWNLVFFSKCTQYTCTVPLGVCVPSKASSELCPEHRSVLGLNRYPRRMLLQVSRREECCRITSCDSSFEIPQGICDSIRHRNSKATTHIAEVCSSAWQQCVPVCPHASASRHTTLPALRPSHTGRH